MFIIVTIFQFLCNFFISNRVEEGNSCGKKDKSMLTDI